MRKFNFILLCLLSLMSCSKEDVVKHDVIIDDSYGIIIGDYSRSDVDYYKVPKNLITTTNGIDLNKDGNVDILLETHEAWGQWMGWGWTRMLIKNNLTEYSLQSKDSIRYFVGDTITKRLNWSNKNYTFHSFEYDNHDPRYFNYYENWIVHDSAFIAVRYNLGTKTKFRYGWIKVVGSETRVTEIVIEK